MSAVNNTASPALSHSAPSSTEILTHGEHLVQFYETDSALVRTVSTFVAEGLSNGDACFVFATQAHCDAVNADLCARGSDPLKVGEGRYLTADAEETFRRISVDGVLSAELFRNYVGGLVEEYCRDGRKVRIFGEIVAVLWEQGRPEVALELEDLWNELQSTHKFVLLCAYPLGICAGEDMGGPFEHICATHSHTLPTESFASITNTDDQNRFIARLQREAATLKEEVARRKRAEEERAALLELERTARVRAEEASRLKDEFLTTVSHELRTPLNAIIGWAHLLRSGGLDSAVQLQAIDTIQRNAKAQAQLVEDLLDVSRVVSGQLRLEFGPVDLATVINAAIDAAQRAAEARQIILSVIIDVAARHTTGDAARLQQVVWNLLSNAIKFTPIGGRVEVRLELAEGSVRLSVRDNGDGIDSAFLPHLFESFRQADGTSTRSHGGMGLGLALVRHLVELQGGSVRATSDGRGRGAEFTVTLPYRKTEPPVGADTSDSAIAVDGHIVDNEPALAGTRVLAVSSNERILDTIRVTLMEREAIVQIASSVSAALAILEWFTPTVMISDVDLTDESARPMIECLRATAARRRSSVGAIGLTSRLRVEDRVNALAAGYDLFVPTPFEPEEIVSAVDGLVRARQ